MKNIIKIGHLEFRHKKEAILHFKKILNSYHFGQTIVKDHFDDVICLLNLHENANEKIGSGIDHIKVDKIRYNTKCFHIIRVDSTIDHFSYLKCINGSYSPLTKFSRACREAVNEDLTRVKLSYFKKPSHKGKVKCQETGDLCIWEELNVDHRQPNSFSVIVDRFIEVNRIDVHSVQYSETVENIFEFIEKDLQEKFRQYHKEKANLRLVKKERNLSRSHQARIQRQNKDLVII